MCTCMNEVPLKVSAKHGDGVDELLPAVVARISRYTACIYTFCLCYSFHVHNHHFLVPQAIKMIHYGCC